MTKEEFVRRLYGDKYIDKQIKKIKLLGKNNKINLYDLIITRLITSILIFVAIIYIFNYGYILAPIVTLIYYFLFNKVTIDDKLKKRNLNIEKDAMHFFEVLTLSLETGRNLVEAIKITTYNVSGTLSNEFKEAVR